MLRWTVGRGGGIAYLRSGGLDKLKGPSRTVPRRPRVAVECCADQPQPGSPLTSGTLIAFHAAFTVSYSVQLSG
ncbi:hypothetical protein GCM10022222_25140 [Amycolatopsis ultiminotia]|uniref:Uncharacterized protein n=1 Tax=Amycolatopsis ultiminotia TaxID=543629 RepID=A0ABP6VXL0_9PSEU